MELFGQSPFGLRFPSMLEFYVGSMALFFFARRKARISYAAAALLILRSGTIFQYATEARPYALLVMSFSTLLLCWDIATTSKKSFRIMGAVLSNLVMLSAHVLAPVSLFPFLAAEVVKFSRTRKADFALWAALLLSVAAIFSRQRDSLATWFIEWQCYRFAHHARSGPKSEVKASITRSARPFPVQSAVIGARGAMKRNPDAHPVTRVHRPGNFPPHLGLSSSPRDSARIARHSQKPVVCFGMEAAIPSQLPSLPAAQQFRTSVLLEAAPTWIH